MHKGNPAVRQPVCLCIVSAVAVTLNNTLNPGWSWGIPPADHVLWPSQFVHVPHRDMQRICNYTVQMQRPKFLCQNAAVSTLKYILPSRAFCCSAHQHKTNASMLTFIRRPHLLHILFLILRVPKFDLSVTLECCKAQFADRPTIALLNLECFVYCVSAWPLWKISYSCILFPSPITFIFHSRCTLIAFPINNTQICHR